MFPDIKEVATIAVTTDPDLFLQLLLGSQVQGFSPQAFHEGQKLRMSPATLSPTPTPTPSSVAPLSLHISGTMALVLFLWGKIL